MEEVARRILSGYRVQRDQPGAVMTLAVRLVETDMAVPPDAQQDDVQPAEPADLRLEVPAMLVDVLRRHRAVEDVDVMLGDIHVVEEVLGHPAVVALEPIGADTVILVQVEGDDAGEVEPLFAVHPDQLPVDADRRGAGGKAKHGILTHGVSLANQVGDHLSDVPGDIVVT